jgi:nitrous oxidase accessory protein
MKKVITLFFVLMGIWIFYSPFASAEVSLQQQIDITPANGIIHLDNKVYSGNIVIKKPLTIVGSQNTVIRGDGKNNVVTIQASNVKLESLKIMHGSINRNTLEEYAGIKITHANENVLKNIGISDSYHGVYLDYANNNLIENIKVTGLGGNKIGEQGNGIHLNFSNHNRLFHSKIKETRDGIYFYKSEGNKVSDNLVEKTRYGLHYMYSDGNQFYHNRFTLNSAGAAIMVSRHIQLKDNEFSFHEGPKAFGILMLESEDVQVVNNQFFHNVRGIYIDNSFKNKVKDNKFSLNQVGIEVLSSSNNQIFTGNRFFDNTAPVITDGVRSYNSWSDKGRGNYWGNGFPLSDLNQDGVGDFPIAYKSSLYKLLNEHELAYLFMKSPAISLYEKLGQLMNGQDIMFEDAYPLVEQKTSFPWTWMSPFILAIGACYLLIRRRRKVKCTY